MKNLFETTTVEELRGRMASLRPENQRQWGKMTVTQMLAHCSAWMEMAAGLKRPRGSVALVQGGRVRSGFPRVKTV